MEGNLSRRPLLGDEEVSNDRKIVVEAGVPASGEHRAINAVTYSVKSAIGDVAKHAGIFSLARLIQTGGEFTSSLMLGSLGTNYLAAAGLMSSIQMAMVGSTSAIINATGILSGKAHEAGNSILLNEIYFNSHYLGLLLSAICISVGVASQKMLGSFGQPTEITEITGKYFNAFVPALPFIFASMTCQQFALGTGKPQFALLSAIAYVTLALTLGYGFIFGKMGFPDEDASGLGYGHCIAALAIFSGFMALFKCLKSYNDFKLFTPSKPSKSTILDMLKLGGPIGVQIGSELTAMFIAAVMMGLLGSDALAAQQIAAVYLYIATAPLFATGQAVGVLVGKAQEQGDQNKAIMLGNTGIAMGLVYSSLVAIIFCSIPEILARPFVDSDDPANRGIITNVNSLLRVHAVGMLLDGIRNISSGALRGLKDTNTAMIMGIISTCVIGLSLAGILAFTPLELGPTSVYAARDVGLSVGALVMFNRWRQQSKTAVPALPAEAPAV